MFPGLHRFYFASISQAKSQDEQNRETMNHRAFIGTVAETSRHISARSLFWRRRYSEVVADGLRDEDTQTFRRCARKRLPAGSARFSAETEEALARRVGN